MAPKRESDRLLDRLRMLVQDSRRANGASSTELETRSREIDRLKSQLADVVKRTAPSEGEQLWPRSR